MKTGVKLFIIFLFCVQTINGADETDISRLRATLFRNYDKNALPVLDSKANGTTVSMYFFNYGFEFDEQKGAITLHAVIYTSWEDVNIKWDPLLYGNLTIVQLSPNELWLPDIIVSNSVEGSNIDHFSDHGLSAENSGRVHWWPMAKFVSGCNLDFYRWPYDMQRCDIILTSWTHTSGEIFLKLESNHTKMDTEDWYIGVLENREWSLLDNNLIEGHTFFGDHSDPEIDIIIRLDIARRYTTHTIGVTAIAIGIAAALLITFWLSPFAKERVPVILTAMLLNSMFLNYMHTVVPPNGNCVPWIVSYFRDSLVLILFALIWTIGLQYIAKTRRNALESLPTWVNSIVDGCCGTLLCLNSRPVQQSHQDRSPETINDEDSEDLLNKEIKYKEDWAWFANILDRIMFVLYLIVYFCFIASF